MNLKQKENLKIMIIVQVEGSNKICDKNLENFVSLDDSVSIELSVFVSCFCLCNHNISKQFRILWKEI